MVPKKEVVLAYCKKTTYYTIIKTEIKTKVKELNRKKNNQKATLTSYPPNAGKHAYPLPQPYNSFTNANIMVKIEHAIELIENI